MNTLNNIKYPTIIQDYSAYTEEQHLAWNRLFERQSSVINGRAIKEFIEGFEVFKEIIKPLPNIEILSAQLKEMVGWSIIPVIGLLESEKYYMYLANKQFPVALFLRAKNNLDFSPEPDIWHDVFGHLPLLVSPLYCKFVEKIGKKWITANNIQKQKISSIYWYIIEVGICQEDGKRRVCGASHLSSFGEIKYALSDKPTIYSFDLQSVSHTTVKIDEIQQNLFELPSFEYLKQIMDEIDLIC